MFEVAEVNCNDDRPLMEINLKVTEKEMTASLKTILGTLNLVSGKITFSTYFAPANHKHAWRLENLNYMVIMILRHVAYTFLALIQDVVLIM